ncbi:Putative transposase InsK for insertion sequence element IS150 [Anaerolineae bacterium]|nr:Putative transposase InsK for insertion sequence element IS150 [Anaerolineae bacterium]
MKFAFILARAVAFPVVVMCRVLGVSVSGFYAWKTRPESERAKADARLAVEVAASHKRSRGRYGSPRVHADLRARGLRVGRKRVERLMRDQGLAARRKRRFRKTTDSAHAQPIAPNVLERDFETSAPNEVWVTDVTYVWTHEGWLYLAAILDLYARSVVGWATSESNDTKLALAALAMASTRRKPPRGLVHHSDRGSPYASDDYRRALAHLGMVASMSRKGDCWDNAVAESFFATLKVELVDDADYATRAAATSSIRDYIESFYNRERRHSHLGYVSPVEYELRTEVASLAA